MSYQALYRVWRPQTFDALVGQDHIRQTLQNAVKNQQLSHAYLFTGPRGTGKTSAAKILAKAVNCLQPEAGNPCNQCQICQAISQGQLSDVVEIDAASNNGVEEIRNLRDNVRYAASQGRYKVYIIDEVHMLTMGAFNALLKTLEEPPSHVIFILATTEPHKIPATIISRTQRFDFRRIADPDLVRRMEEVLEAESIRFEGEALAIIARAANGGMRDALSLLDQALSYDRDQVTLDSALTVSGSLSQLAFVDFVQACYRGQAQAALDLVNSQLQAGKQAQRFIEELILFARDILLTLYTGDNKSLVSEEELQAIRQDIPADFYYQLIDFLNAGQDRMRFSNQPEVYLQTLTVQLASQAWQDPEAGETLAGDPKVKDQVRVLQEQVSQLQADLDRQNQVLQGLKSQVEAHQDPDPVPPLNEGAPVEKTPRPRPQQSAYQLETQEVFSALTQATKEDLEALKAAWPGMVQEIPPQQRTPLLDSQPRAAGNGLAVISIKNAAYCGMVQHNRDLVEALVSQGMERLDYRPQFIFVTHGDWQISRSNYASLYKQYGGNIPAELLQGPDPGQGEASPLAQPAPETQELPASQASPREAGQAGEAPPELAQKAIDLFGKDRVQIIYDSHTE